MPTYLLSFNVLWVHLNLIQDCKCLLRISKRQPQRIPWFVAVGPILQSTTGIKWKGLNDAPIVTKFLCSCLVFILWGLCRFFVGHNISTWRCSHRVSPSYTHIRYTLLITNNIHHISYIHAYFTPSIPLFLSYYCHLVLLLSLTPCQMNPDASMDVLLVVHNREAFLRVLFASSCHVSAWHVRYHRLYWARYLWSSHSPCCCSSLFVRFLGSCCWCVLWK